MGCVAKANRPGTFRVRGRTILELAAACFLLRPSEITCRLDMPAVVFPLSRSPRRLIVPAD